MDSPTYTFGFLVCLGASISACATVERGADPFPSADVGDEARPDAAMTTRGPLDADFFFCRVQPEVIRASRCASTRGCHATDSGLRLLADAETIEPPTCIDDHPVGAVPAAYYTNLARSRAETRPSARASDLYWRPLGNDHPERMYAETSREAAIVRAWIEGSAL